MRLTACLLACVVIAGCASNPLQSDAVTTAPKTVAVQPAATPTAPGVNCEPEKSTYVTHDGGITTTVTNGSTTCTNDYLGAMFYMPHPPPDWASQALVDLVDTHLGPGESRTATKKVPVGDCVPYQADWWFGITRADAGEGGKNIHPATLKYFPVEGTGITGRTGCAPTVPPTPPVPPPPPPPPPPPSKECRDVVRDAHVYGYVGEAWFTILPGAAGSVQISLVAYELNPNSPTVFLPQKFYDGVSGQFTPGNWHLDVKIPGKWQVDLLCGDFKPEDLTEKNFDDYNKRTIAWDRSDK